MKITIGQALSAATLALSNASELLAAIQRAHDEGRPELTEAEVDRFASADDMSRKLLQAEIDKLG